MPCRLAIVVSHPIQYFVPLYRLMAADPGLAVKVFYASDHSVRGGVDPGFGVKVAWDIPLLDGYEHEFLPNEPWGKGPFWEYHCPALAARLAEGRFDAVLVSGYGQLLGWQAWRTAGKLGIPLLVRSESMDGTRVKRGPWKTWVRNAVLRRWYSRVAAGLAIARYMERHYLEHGIPSERIFWTPYCVDNRRFRERANELPAKAELKGRLGLEGCELVVLFCGKLQPKKDPLLLTAAIRAMANRARAGLLVVGDGELRREMEKAAENCGARKVVFAGFKNQTELPACYAASDVLVLPSPYGETWGLVVNEGMNFGLPAIVSDHVGCAHDLVRHEETGYVFRASDPIALAGFLDHLASHPDVLAKLGASARQRVASYSIEACVQGMKQALQAVCASGGRGAPGK